MHNPAGTFGQLWLNRYKFQVIFLSLDGLAVRQLIIHGKFRNQLISLHKSGTGSLPCGVNS